MLIPPRRPQVALALKKQPASGPSRLAAQPPEPSLGAQGPGQAAAAASAPGSTGGGGGAQPPAPRLIPPTAAAWQAAEALARPRAPPQLHTPPGSPAPAAPRTQPQLQTPPRSPAGSAGRAARGPPEPQNHSRTSSQNPSPATSEGRFTLLPGYVSRPQPSPAKPAPQARPPGPPAGGFVRFGSHPAAQEAHSAWPAGTHERAPVSRAMLGPGLGPAAGVSSRSLESDVPGASPAGEAPAPAAALGAGSAAAGAAAVEARPARRPRKRKQGGLEAQCDAPDAGLLLIGGLRRILAEQPTQQARGPAAGRRLFVQHGRWHLVTGLELAACCRQAHTCRLLA